MPGGLSASTYQGYNSHIYSHRHNDTHTGSYISGDMHVSCWKWPFPTQQQTLPEARQGVCGSSKAKKKKRQKIRSQNPFQTFNGMTRLQRGSKGIQIDRGRIFDLSHSPGHLVMLTFKTQRETGSSNLFCLGAVFSRLKAGPRGLSKWHDKWYYLFKHVWLNGLGIVL